MTKTGTFRVSVQRRLPLAFVLLILLFPVGARALAHVTLSAVAQFTPETPGTTTPQPQGIRSIQEKPATQTPALGTGAAELSRQFLHFIIILLIGLVISIAQLATKFRRFLRLGVFTNWYALLFLVFGALLCAVPVTSQGAVASYLGASKAKIVPWITDAFGVLVTIILPMIRLKSPSSGALASPIRDLATGGSNPLIAVIEEGIRDRILVKMHARIAQASLQYNWTVIKQAARRMLEEEITVGRIGQPEADAVLQSIETFQPIPDLRTDSSNKYTALLRLLRLCSFSRLRDSLMAAARENQ